jgi:alkylhydroperoxidase family enzyme
MPMMRVPFLPYKDASPSVRAIWDEQVQHNGRMTNMKRTLAHSLPALDALLTWYPLHDAVAGFLGERATTIFTLAISLQTDCLICSTFFRRILTEDGDNPDALRLDEREEILAEFGRQLAVDSNQVGDALYARVAGFLTPQQIVTLTAFGAIMIATNVFNNALNIELDEYLLPYRASSKDGETGEGGEGDGQ